MQVSLKSRKIALFTNQEYLLLRTIMDIFIVHFGIFCIFHGCFNLLFTWADNIESMNFPQ